MDWIRARRFPTRLLFAAASFSIAAASGLSAAPSPSPVVVHSLKNRTSPPLRDFRMNGPVVPMSPRDVRKDPPDQAVGRAKWPCSW
jgi:hypothetical protein